MSLPKTPSFRVDGRKALVTGAGRGIGRASAVALADAGADVVLAARTGAEVDALADEIRASGGQASGLALDVSDLEATRAAVGEHGPFQILVNNAGTNRPAFLQDITEDDYDLVTNLNVRSVVFLTQTVAKGLQDVGLSGSIINISSQMGHVGGPKRTVYCATKHALEGITKALAWELGPDGIRVNTICPTFIVTPMSKPMLEDKDFHNLVVSSIALGRVGQVEEIMGAVVYLASNASSLVTGAALMVDGGWTAA